MCGLHGLIGRPVKPVEALRQAALQEFGVPDDNGEQVVEVVRNATGELADGLHLLRLAQRLSAFMRSATSCATRSSRVSFRRLSSSLACSAFRRARSSSRSYLRRSVALKRVMR
ncbi:hypothetical protein [Microvirga yunnanensis]|uniref:hypothetical protein n=1 Tax=Microvirga yunnanensis TaxID=2953740 RepID=UPI0035A1A401